MKTYVLYHANCPDGFCAAWVAHGVLRGEIDFIPVQYGQPSPPIEPWSRVYILDFSYPREQLLSLWKSGLEHLVVLDHHKTAQEALEGFADECERLGLDRPKIVFDMDKSGARLAWDHFYGNSGMAAPWLVEYVEDRDLWRWKKPQSKEVSAALASYPRTFEQWSLFHNHRSPDTLAQEGGAILRYQTQLIDNICAAAREVEIGGHKVMAANTACLFSEVAGKLAEDKPFGAAWFIRSDGKKQWSLRSRDGGIDVAAVAKPLGGGGHRNAAGFEE